MKTFGLVDTAFAHCDYSAPGIKSGKIKWDRTLYTGTVFHTHEQMLSGPSEFNSGVDYGWLLESQAIIPRVYNKLENSPELVKKFARIFTHSSVLLQKYKNTYWIPGGSIWVGGEYGGGEIKIYEKTKLCSMVSSDKRMCKLHKLRIAVAEFLSTQNTGIDFYGSLFGKWVPIIETLKDYRFSICIENFVDDLYFTEKLLNCFATGTIPIYLGAKNIGRLFNTKGMICFERPGELLDILVEDMNNRFYENAKDAIAENFELCKRFRLCEDYIYETYL